MEVFWLLFLFLTILEMFFSLKQETPELRTKKSICYGLATALVLALRSPQNGIDLAEYSPLFLTISNHSLADVVFGKWEHFEKGFLIYNKIVSYITRDVQMFLAITSFITIGGITWTIHKYSKNIYLSFIVFICFGVYDFCFSGLRQAMAFSITFVSYMFIIEKKPVHFVLTVLLATTFHKSALIFLPAWFIRNKRLSPQLGTTILLFFFVIVLPLLRPIVSFLADLLFSGKYSRFEDEGGATTMAIVYTIIFLCSFFFKSSSERLNSFRWMILIAVFTQWLGYISTGSMTRIGLYYNIFFCLLVPELAGNLQKKLRPIGNIAVVTLFILFFVLNNTRGFSYMVLPYHFFWEPGYQDFILRINR